MKTSRLLLVFCGAVFTAILVVSALLRNQGWFHLNSEQRAVALMDRGTNITTTFYGRVVDERGHPLGGAEIEITIGGINEQWANSPKGELERGAENSIHRTSDANGEFSFVATGTVILIKAVRKDGYRWLYDLQTGEERGTVYACNTFYEIALDHRPGPYHPDPKSPAQFVLVQNGVTDVVVCPSRGGKDVNPVIGRNRINVPTWPVRLSLAGVRYVPATTLPTTER